VPEHKVERELLLASLESSSSASVLGTAVTFRGSRSQSGNMDAL
jgi:hypothetical protein